MTEDKALYLQVAVILLKGTFESGIKKAKLLDSTNYRNLLVPGNF